MCKQPSSEPSTRERVKATLHLEDGSKFEGYSFGAATGVGGEVGTYDLFWLGFISMALLLLLLVVIFGLNGLLKKLFCKHFYLHFLIYWKQMNGRYYQSSLYTNIVYY